MHGEREKIHHPHPKKKHQALECKPRLTETREHTLIIVPQSPLSFYFPHDIDQTECDQWITLSIDNHICVLLQYISITEPDIFHLQRISRSEGCGAMSHPALIPHVLIEVFQDILNLHILPKL